MHAEGTAEVLGGRGGADHGVAGRRPDALADPVGGDHGGDPGRARGEQQEHARDGGEPVAEEGDPLRAVRGVGQPAAAEADQRADSLVEAVDEAVRHRREADDRGEVEREDRGDRLRRHVGQQRHDPERDDDPAHGGPGRGRAAGRCRRRVGRGRRCTSRSPARGAQRGVDGVARPGASGGDRDGHDAVAPLERSRAGSRRRSAGSPSRPCPGERGGCGRRSGPAPGRGTSSPPARPAAGRPSARGCCSRRGRPGSGAGRRGTAAAAGPERSRRGGGAS